MKIGLLGCGAMGSIYGGYLSRVHAVYVCDVWEENIKAIWANGIRIDEPEGTVVCRPNNATTDPDHFGPMDLVITFVKYNLLEQALRNASAMIGPETIVLSLQNGIGNYEEIAKVVPEQQICCGTTAHGSTFLEPGHVRHTGKGVTNIGTIKGSVDMVRKVGDALEQAGFDVVISDHVMELVWHKLFANIGVNAITALLEQPNASIAENPYERELAEHMVREAVTVANANGMNFNEEKELEFVFGAALATGTNRSSMLQDMMKRHETEIKIINGAVVKLGREKGIPTPYNDAICSLVHAKQKLYLK